MCNTRIDKLVSQENKQCFRCFPLGLDNITMHFKSIFCGVTAFFSRKKPSECFEHGKTSISKVWHLEFLSLLGGGRGGIHIGKTRLRTTQLSIVYLFLHSIECTIIHATLAHSNGHFVFLYVRVLLNAMIRQKLGHKSCRTSYIQKCNRIRVVFFFFYTFY